jgi:hypothetical protein
VAPPHEHPAPAARRTRAAPLPLRALPSALLGWLLDRPDTPRPARYVFDAAVLAAFVAAVTAGALHHEIWRDEARALSIALEPSSWLALPAALEDEGHPAAWHLLLRAAHAVAPTPLVLPVVTAVVGVAAAVLLYCAAPLPTWWRAAYVFGHVPLHQGAILCRNYGIAMLLLHAFCALAASRRGRPLVAALVLALLANTNAYAAMMAASLGVVLLAGARRRGATMLRTAIAGAVVAGGLAFAAWTVLPTPASKLRPAAPRTLGELGDALADAVSGFASTAGPVFGTAAAAWPIVLLAAVAALPAKHVVIAVLGFFVAAAVFTARVYSAAPHHLGMLYAFLVAATWLRAGVVHHERHRAARGAWRALLFGVWPLLLVIHGYHGLRAIARELETTATAAPELARLLDRPELRSAVLIGEPDYFLDALPWYRDNPIFVAREDRFARRVSWTTANRRESDLGELLAAGRALQRAGHGPVLFVIGAPVLLEQPDGDVVHGYGDRFRWTPEQRRAFTAATEHVASLPAEPARLRGDERYEVHRLRAP